jgi:hypothetical protein
MRCIVVGLMLIVATSLESQTPATLWTLVPDLRIGSVDASDYILTEVRSLAIGPDGTMYLGQDGGDDPCL